MTQIQPQITYRGMPHSAAMDARIQQLTHRMEDLHPRITLCNVVVNEIDKHQTQGNLFDVRIDLHIPGKELVVTKQHSEDAYAAISGAFVAMFQQLEEEVRNSYRTVMPAIRNYSEGARA